MVESIGALLGTSAGATTAASLPGAAAATPSALAASLSATPGSAGLLGQLGITAGGGAAPTIGSLGQASALGVEGIAGGQTLGLLNRPTAAQIPAPSPQEFPAPLQAPPLGNDPELIQLLIEAINNSRRGQA